MADARTTVSDAGTGAGTRTVPGFELRLERGGAHVRLSAAASAGGLVTEVLDLEVPDVTLPFDVGAGPSLFQNRLCELCRLDVRLEPELVSGAAARLDLAALGLGGLEVALREGFLEVAGRLLAGPGFALRLGLVPGFERGVAVVPYAPRLFGPAPIPAAALPHLAARALAGLGLPDDPLPLLLRRLLVARGWKVPREGAVRLALAALAPAGVRLAWDRDAAGPAGAPAHPDLLAAVEGARAFADAEALLAAGELAGARDAFLASPAAAAHPFGAERILSLLCLEERFHDEALDLAAEWQARRPGFTPALVAEAWIRTVRGEGNRAALALAALAEDAVAHGERLAAAAAAEAALAAPGAGPAALQRAVDAALAVKRDHLPALRALRALARAAGDKGAHVRAVRRLLAYAPGDAEKARAHAELGELLLERDPPAARLHLDRALRLAPDDAESLETLAHACAAAGEHLRAVRALDRLRALRLAAGDRDEAARLALAAGALWEKELDHPENALLRYREAAELGPGAARAHALAAGCAERLGRWAEAADHHAAAISQLDRRAPGAAAQAAAHHLALADVAERRLDDPAGAATHLEAALAEGPPDAPRLARLAALYRRLGRAAELAAALDRLAPLAATPGERAALLAEAGDLWRGPLSRPDAAQVRFVAALAHDPGCRPALDGLAAVASLRGDAPAEREALARLLPLATSPAEEALLQDRLASACDRAGDLAGAVRAVAAARRAAPTRARLAAAVGLARRLDDPRALAGLLDELARACAADGDLGAAAAAWRERSERLEAEDPPLALAALAEARALLPGDAGLLRRQASLAARAGDHALALGALRALLAGAPPDAPALELEAARAALAAGQPAEARPHAGRALDAGVPGALELLADALARSGDEAGRAGLLSRLGRHLEAAALHEQAGDAAAALAAYQAAAAVPATAAEALRALIRLRARAGDAAGTAEALLAAARLAGGREGAELALRAFQLAPGDEALDAAVAADGAFAPARAERARRRAATDPAGALADAEAALAGEPLDPARRPELLRLSARLAGRAGDAELQRRRLAAWCQLGAPDDGELATLCALQRAAGDLDGLIVTLERRLAGAPPAEAVPLRLELAPLLVTHGRDLEAVARWREVLLADRSALPALRALLDPARAAALHDGEAEALRLLVARHPEAPDPERAEAWSALARARELGGDAAGALAALAEAARLRGDDDQGLEQRGELARRAGDLPAAAAALLTRARRGLERGEAGAAERLAEAGLLALEAGRGADGAQALRDAVALPLEPEAARAALTALCDLAARTGDAAAEAAALAPLVHLLPTGERPGRLLRLSALRAAAGDAAAALAAAEEARALAPRDLETVHQARAAAEAAGRHDRVAALLAEEAALDARHAGPLQLDRARLLARLGEPAAADDAYSEALRALAPDPALAAEQARHRRRWLPDRPAAGPLEACARRSTDPAASARASLAAAALAVQAGQRDVALRCARRAFGRRRAAPAEAGPLLARLLYEQGAFAEALVLHRALLEQGFQGFDEAEVVTLCRQLAELAAEAGELELARAALDRLLALRPQDPEAGLARFALDPDRRRAVTGLAAVAGSVRSEATRAALLAQAGDAALVELRDRPLGERLHREARAEAARVPGLPVQLAVRRARATRAADLGPEALLAALHEASELAQAGGDAALARALLEEAVAEERQRGMKGAAARDLLQLEALCAAEGDFGAAAARALEAGLLLGEAGEAEAAAEALRRAAAGDPADERALRALVEVSRPRGAAGAADLCLALEALADRARPGEARAEALGRLAAAQSSALGDDRRAEATLRAALAEAPGDPAAEAALLALLARAGRGGDRARLLLERARRHADPAVRAGYRREAGRLLAASSDPAERLLAAEALAAVALDAPDDLEAARAAAAALLAAGRRDEAVPHLAAILRAAPDDDAAAAELVTAFAGRHRERAELLLSRAARAEGPARAERLREAARAFTDAGDEPRARQALAQAFDAWPADDEGFGAALGLAGTDVDRLDAVLLARAEARPSEAHGCHRARADVLFASGRSRRAIAAYEAALALEDQDPAALAALGACLAEVGGLAAARGADRRLCELAGAQPHAVPASLEAEARYRLALGADPDGPAGQLRVDLERALWLAPDDRRADLAFDALVDVQLRLGEPEAAMAVARARAERAAARGDAEAERRALEAGAALAQRLAEPGPDGAEVLEALLTRHADAGAPLETLVPLAIRAAAAWRSLGAEPRARAALELAGIAPPPLLVPVPTPPPEELETVAEQPVAEAPAAEEPAAEELVAEPPIEEPPAEEQPAEEPPIEEPPLAEDSVDPRAEAEALALAAQAIADPVERAAAWVGSAEALARAGATADEVRAALELACDADPDGPAAWRALASHEERAGHPLAAARAHLAVSIRTEGDAAALAALTAAGLFEEDARHPEAARAYRAANLARPRVVPASLILAEDALGRGDLAAAAENLGLIEPETLPAAALAGFQRALARVAGAAATPEAPPPPAPDSAPAPAPEPAPPPTPERAQPPEPPQPPDRAAELRSLVRAHAGAGNRRALAALLAEAEATLGVEALRPFAASLGRAAFEAGRAEDAYRWLSLARQDAPEELTLARDLSRAAERTGRHAEEVALGVLCADDLAPHDPLAAAARYRHFGKVLAERLGDLGAATSMLERALALVPDDADARRDLWHLWARRGETRDRALAAWLDAARADPSDGAALAEVAALSERLAAGAPAEEAARLQERARLAASLAAFAAPGHLAPPLRLAALVPDVARDRVAAPGAVGPLGQLLSLLAPYLEPLFPADLARRGATAADRLAPPRAPVVREALEAAGRILGARPYVAFLVDRPGVDLAIENTQPPSLVIPAAVEALPASAVHFLAARAVDLLGRGWALSGKFAPKDVGILLELACRFAGGAPPPLGLPPQRADAFLSALARSVPASVAARAAPLGSGAAEELSRTDVRELSAAIRRTGARVALLATGDPGAALSALLLLERQRPASPDAAAALALPDLRDLASLALSDPFLDLRVAVIG